MTNLMIRVGRRGRLRGRGSNVSPWTPIGSSRLDLTGEEEGLGTDFRPTWTGAAYGSIIISLGTSNLRG